MMIGHTLFDVAVGYVISFLDNYLKNPASFTEAGFDL